MIPALPQEIQKQPVVSNAYHHATPFWRPSRMSEETHCSAALQKQEEHSELIMEKIYRHFLLILTEVQKALQSVLDNPPN
jgi:hypothetical protein